MKSMKLLLASVPEMCSLRRMQSVGKLNMLFICRLPALILDVAFMAQKQST